MLVSQLAMFVQNFDANGPGAVGLNMDLGLTLMEHYDEQFALLEQQRQEFGMPTSEFSNFSALIAIADVVVIVVITNYYCVSICIFLILSKILARSSKWRSFITQQ